MKTRLFECCSILGLATAVAVLERLKRAEHEGVQNVLLLSNHARYPEVENTFADNGPLLERAQTRFDRVLSLNDMIAPQHPGAWRYHSSWLAHRKLWLDALGAERVDELVLESIQVPPAWSLAQLFSEARIRVYSDGLMVYSPTRTALPVEVAKRVTDVYYAALVPGVVPLLLREASPNYVTLELEELSFVFPKPETNTRANKALFLGQAMANAEMITHDEELALYERGLTNLFSLSGLEVAFKPHPASPQALTRKLVRRIEKKLRKKLHVLDDGRAVEASLASGQVALTASVFSTGLFTSLGLYQIPAFATGTEECLERLTPFENSNRIPLIAADVLLPKLEDLTREAKHGGDVLTHARRMSVLQEDAIARFVRAQKTVGYYMQPALLPELAMEAKAELKAQSLSHLSLYLHGCDTDTADENVFSQAFLQGVVTVGTRFLDARRASKLQRDPVRFMRDSTAPALQILGRVHRTLKRVPLAGKDTALGTPID